MGRERVAWLMRREGIQARPPKRKLPQDKGPRLMHALAPNALDRSFHTDPAEPALGSGLYLHLGHRGLAVCSGCH